MMVTRLAYKILIFRLLVAYLCVSYAALWYSVLRTRNTYHSRSTTLDNQTITALPLPPSVLMQTPVTCTIALNAIFIVVNLRVRMDWMHALSRLRHVLFYWQARGLLAHVYIFSAGHVAELHNECDPDVYCQFLLVPDPNKASDGHLKRLAASKLDRGVCAVSFRDIVVLRSADAHEKLPVIDYSIIDRAAVAPRQRGTCLESEMSYNSRRHCLLYVLRYSDKDTLVTTVEANTSVQTPTTHIL